ncbi:putrescine transport system substrate-binding protein [Sinobacterium caligoides]|uniref:Putrescine-binding periplasmic protein n=1 Tax=Sinobacterium caligoides TaxID=933926 RepID=A0A3N2DRA7_9GAMM|nr:extracellular solute-binding protein [Sinobacterium caligoides]ROS01835.1 putrescine transport system substrate-binding protein [Sinobacterium caligoides]
MYLVRTTIAVMLFLTGVSQAAFADEPKRELNLYNWSDYLAEDTLEKFTAETGITVNLTTFEEEEEMRDALDSGTKDYDLVVVALDYMAKSLMAQKYVFKPLNKDLLPNLSNMDQKAMAYVGEKDPFNNFGVPYLWGTIGIGYDAKMVNKIFAGKAPTDSWAMLFEVANLKKLSQCGVAFVDSPDEVLPLIINYLGGDPNTADKSVYSGMAQERLNQIAPYVTFNTDQIDPLVEGEYCAVLGWSGDVLYAAELAEEADAPVDIQYSLPKEGASTWYDMFAIPKNSSHVAEAHEFINFMMKPEIIAEVSNYIWYPNSNAKAKPFMDEEILNDKNIYPTAEMADKLYLIMVASKRLHKHQLKIWNEAAGK